MGLVSKSKQLQSEELTKQELEFLLAKLRSANYKGEEFELYFSIVKKITDSLKLLK
jgi:thiamine monophosphate kinase